MHKPKKSLGQNFLKSEMALRKIIEAGEINPVRGREGSQRPSASNGVKNQDLVLEIGPGRGALTQKLLQAGARVIAVEKDRKLFEFLKNKFEKEIRERSLVLLHEDILNFEIHKVVRQDLATYKVIANIPYNITGAILKKFLTAPNQPERMVLMVQREVGQRIMGQPAAARGSGEATKESILSISVKAYGKPKILTKVPSRYFAPAPKVDSAVIKIGNISRKIFQETQVNEGNFWEIVKTGFAHKRKKLSGNLKGVVEEEKLRSMGLSDKRAEDLTLENWINLAK